MGARNTKAGHDAEGPASAERNKLGFSNSGGMTNLCPQARVAFERTIDGKTLLAAEIAVPAAQGQPGDAGGPDESERDCLAKRRLGGVIDIAARVPTQASRL